MKTADIPLNEVIYIFKENVKEERRRGNRRRDFEFSTREMVDRVEKQCKAQGITVEVLLFDCGLAANTISLLKDGTIPYDKLCKIADYLGCSPEYICMGIEAEEYFKAYRACGGCNGCLKQRGRLI